MSKTRRRSKEPVSSIIWLTVIDKEAIQRTSFDNNLANFQRKGGDPSTGFDDNLANCQRQGAIQRTGFNNNLANYQREGGDPKKRYQ